MTSDKPKRKNHEQLKQRGIMITTLAKKIRKENPEYGWRQCIKLAAQQLKNKNQQIKINEDNETDEEESD